MVGFLCVGLLSHHIIIPYSSHIPGKTLIKALVKRYFSLRLHKSSLTGKDRVMRLGAGREKKGDEE